jgi:hypothetical protein
MDGRRIGGTTEENLYSRKVEHNRIELSARNAKSCCAGSTTSTQELVRIPGEIVAEVTACEEDPKIEFANIWGSYVCAWETSPIEVR